LIKLFLQGWSLIKLQTNEGVFDWASFNGGLLIKVFSRGWSLIKLQTSERVFDLILFKRTGSDLNFFQEGDL
jgi:hypothetical protein